jgi:tetratricopeptide (TPR) repeat protein
MKNVYALLVATLLASACNMNEFSVNLTAPVLHEASKAFAMEGDLRLAREAAPAQLVTLTGFLFSAPKNRFLLETCAQGYAEYAFGFLEDDLEALPDDEKHADEREHLTRRATVLYDKALDFALRLLANDDKHFEAAFKKDASSTEEEAKKLDKDSVAGLMFAGMSLASSINLNRNDVARVVDLPKAIVMIKRAYQIDPKFYNGGAAMLLGVIYASQGKAMGGNPEAAKKYFDEAIATTGGKYLLTKVMMARFYGVVTQDRPFFEATLKQVLDTPSEVFPEQRLANELAKRRAKRYLEHVEDYF